MDHKRAVSRPSIVAVGVANLGPKCNDRLSSSSVGLSVSMTIPVSMFVSGLAHRSGCANERLRRSGSTVAPPTFV